MRAGRYFVVMELVPWEQMKLSTDDGSARPFPIRIEGRGMVGFMPVFRTRAAAEAWSGGRHRIEEVKTTRRKAPA